MKQPPARPLVEVAVDSLEVAEMAWSLDADRIELCQALEVGGLTPSPGLMEAVVAAARGPVFAMIRTKPGDFVLAPNELAVALRDIAAARAAGCAGVVVGPLLPNDSLAIESITKMVAAAGEMSVTFHRAFDRCPRPVESLVHLIDLGITRVLSSGGAETAFAGRERLARLVARAGARLTVIGGGGVTADQVVQLVEGTGLGEIHLSGSHQIAGNRAGGFGLNTLPNPARLIRLLEVIERAFGPKR